MRTNDEPGETGARAPIYLDHAATTPLLPSVAEALAVAYTTIGANPASQHAAGRRARQVLEEAREAVGAALGARQSGHQADQILFTSGGTEANNLAIRGLARAASPQGPAEVIISAIEHPSVLGPAEQLERHGWRVHRAPVTTSGVVDVAAIRELISPATKLVSVMLGNNETGALQPVAEIARLAHAAGAVMHTDSSQCVGKIPVDFAALEVDALTVAAHKLHGPVGIGALVLRHGISPTALLHGGFQQEGLRPGTEAVALAVGLRAALEAWQEDIERTTRFSALRNRLEQQILAGYAGAVVNAADVPRLPQTSNIAFVGCERQRLLMALDLAGIACSTGSACASGSSEPSHVLLAMGLAKEIVGSSLRFSVGATTTEAEIDEAAKRIVGCVRCQ